MSLSDLLDAWRHAGVPAPIPEAEFMIKLINDEGYIFLFFFLSAQIHKFYFTQYRILESAINNKRRSRKSQYHIWVFISSSIVRPNSLWRDMAHCCEGLWFPPVKLWARHIQQVNCLHFKPFHNPQHCVFTCYLQVQLVHACGNCDAQTTQVSNAQPDLYTMQETVS